MTVEEVARFNGVDSGWIPYVLKMDEEIREIDKEARPFQIKQKWGSLRAYYDLSEDTVDDEEKCRKIQEVIDKYEMIVSTICERCGSSMAERDTVNGYVTTLCTSCRSKLLSRKTLVAGVIHDRVL